MVSRQVANSSDFQMLGLGYQMRQVPLERDINIAVNGCSGFATSTQKEPFMAMVISRSKGTCLIAYRSDFSWIIHEVQKYYH